LIYTEFNFGSLGHVQAVRFHGIPRRARITTQQSMLFPIPLLVHFANVDGGEVSVDQEYQVQGFYAILLMYLQIFSGFFPDLKFPKDMLSSITCTIIVNVLEK